MTSLASDARWMASAIALAGRGRAMSSPNPNVGCVLVHQGRVVGRGWTQAGGRPHAEAMALSQAGEGARGSTCYVTLEPCAHDSPRGAACTDELIAAGVARVVIACIDPDPRTNGMGAERLRSVHMQVETGLFAAEARQAMAGWWSQIVSERPFVTLKLATSLDGCIALAGGESRWITGEAARAHGHSERARTNMILVGRGTYAADAPLLDVRLPGLADRSPKRAILTQGVVPEGWTGLASPDAANPAQWLLIEGGAGAAAAFVGADRVDRLLLYRAPILIGGGRVSLGDIGLARLGDAQGRWCHKDHRRLGSDTLDVYDRIRAL
jgi:diaminohydroxyphosphoribosylaminopyrimidine deaminase/5-amino-6-(5-phosphoribosylamino)uracil reductase